MRICVFCSSSEPAVARYGEVARAVGRRLAEDGHELVYGGTAVGLMGVLAAAARDAGGRVVGILPRLLVERGLADEACDELVVTDGMADRKTAMVQRAEAFLAIPGGLGTLDELLEVLTLKQLGYHEAPVAIYGPDGFWDELTTLFVRLHREGLSLPPDELALVTASLDDALEYLRRGRDAPDRVWRA